MIFFSTPSLPHPSVRPSVRPTDPTPRPPRNLLPPPPSPSSGQLSHDVERSLSADARGRLRLCEAPVAALFRRRGRWEAWGGGKGAEGGSSVSLAVRPLTKTNPGGESRRCYFCLGMCASQLTLRPHSAATLRTTAARVVKSLIRTKGCFFVFFVYFLFNFIYFLSMRTKQLE